jgi:hypothetical protein
MNSKLATGLLTLVWVTGCSTTHFQASDYYEKKAMKSGYPVGVEVSVEKLTCHKSINGCDLHMESKWKTHRKYTKDYYFE